MLGVDVKDKILSGRIVPEAEVNTGILKVRFREISHSEIRRHR